MVHGAPCLHPPYDEVLKCTGNPDLLSIRGHTSAQKTENSGSNTENLFAREKGREGRAAGTRYRVTTQNRPCPHEPPRKVASLSLDHVQKIKFTLSDGAAWLVVSETDIASWPQNSFGKGTVILQSAESRGLVTQLAGKGRC